MEILHYSCFDRQPIRELFLIDYNGYNSAVCLGAYFVFWYPTQKETKLSEALMFLYKIMKC